MPRRFLKKHLPDFQKLRGRRELRWLGRLLDDPYLLHLNRRSVAGGVACGLFVGFLPMPGHMLLAAALAILFRINLLLAVALVWVSNPLTMPPIFYFNYLVGTWIIGSPETAHIGFEPSLSWFWEQFERIWKPLLVGSLSVGSLLALASYGSVQLLWRLHIIRQLKRRRQRQAARSHPAIGERQS
ncbi:MAG TPA: DUF2062 domain-containing protein [Nitrococcus sp.]|nr:DUF2062 domain-containing protein [Nitrococcus sp.]